MNKNIIIGICDDDKEVHKELEQYCRDYFGNNSCVSYINFWDGKDVLDYCQNMNGDIIQLLFLDIEMNLIDGLEVLNLLMHDTKIWRIAFVSSHTESVLDTFSIKTIGFVPKPVEKARLGKILDSLIEEYQDNVEIEVPCGNHIEYIKSEEIIYLKAGGSYTEIYAKRDNDIHKYIIAKKIGEMESIIDARFFIRVHKSYIVNAEYVVTSKVDITLSESEVVIPIGRKYKNSLVEKLRNYKMLRMERRL